MDLLSPLFMVIVTLHEMVVPSLRIYRRRVVCVQDLYACQSDSTLLSFILGGFPMVA